MPKKEPNNTQLSFKEKKKAETAIIKGTITREQKEIIQNFIGILGSNEQDVIGKIITLWLYNEGHLKIKEGKKN